MEVDFQILADAMRKAVETSLIPKTADSDTYIRNWEAMKAILQQAIQSHNAKYAR